MVFRRGIRASDGDRRDHREVEPDGDKDPFNRATATALSLIREHLALVFSIAAAVAFGIRVVSISHGDTNVAYAFLASGSVFTLLLSTVLFELPLVTALLVPVAFIALGGQPWRSKWATRIALLLPLVILAPTLYVSLCLLGLPVAAWQTRRQERRQRTARRGGLRLSTYYLFVLSPLAILLLDDPPYPSEVIETDGRLVTGYVINDGDPLTIIEDNPRRVVRMPVDEVDNREVCDINRARLADYARANLISLVLGVGGGYPECPQR